jgi:hypothetical protein
MNTSLSKIIISVIVIVGLFFFVKNFLVSGPKPIDNSNQQGKNCVGDANSRLSPETEKPKPQQQSAIKQAESARSEPNQVSAEAEVEQLNPHADSLYQMALVESQIAKKPMMSYGRMVNYCRQILQQYPDSRYVPKARELLRKMPERERAKYNITDEELGLSK